VAAVEVGTGSRGARRDGIVVHREGAVGVLVADLEHHRPTDGVGEVLAIGRSYEDALVPHGCAFRSLVLVTDIIWQERGKRIPRTHQCRAYSPEYVEESFWETRPRSSHLADAPGSRCLLAQRRWLTGRADKSLFKIKEVAPEEAHCGVVGDRGGDDGHAEGECVALVRTPAALRLYKTRSG
jgi:hypothetical protein